MPLPTPRPSRSTGTVAIGDGDRWPTCPRNRRAVFASTIAPTSSVLASSSTRCWRDSRRSGAPPPATRSTPSCMTNRRNCRGPIRRFRRSSASSATASRNNLTSDFRTSGICSSIWTTAPPATAEPSRAARHRRSRRAMLAAAGLVALAAAAAIGAVVAAGAASGVRRHRRLIAFCQMTDFVGLEEFPSISPDGNMVAFTAAQGGRRQVFIRFLNGGPARPVTSDDADHQLPRWLPDGSSLVYFSPAAPGEVQGAIYKIPTLGGSSQRVIASIGGGDVSRTGRLACFRLGERTHSTGHVHSRRLGCPSELRLSRRGTTGIRGGPPTTSGSRFRRATASAGTSTRCRPAAATPVNLTNDNRFIEGLTWLPDSSGIVLRLEPRQHRSRICLRWRCGRCRWTAGGRRGNSRRPKRRTSNPTCTRPASCPPPGCRCGSTSGGTRSTASRATIVRPRPAGHASDRTGVDADRRAGRRADCLSLRQRRPLQYLGDVGRRGHHARSPFENDPSGGRRYPDLVTGRTMDCVRVVQRQRPIRLRRLAGQAGWQRTAPARDQRPGRRLVTERRRHLLRGDRVQRHEEGRGERRRAR